MFMCPIEEILCKGRVVRGSASASLMVKEDVQLFLLFYYSLKNHFLVETASIELNSLKNGRHNY